MGVCDCEYPYFTMKPKRLQRRSKFHAMFVKDFGSSAVGKKEPGYVTYSRIDLLRAKSAVPRRIRFHCCVTNMCRNDELHLMMS